MTRSFAIYTGKKGMCEIDLALREEFAMYNAKDYVKHLYDTNFIKSDEADTLIKMITSKDLGDRTVAYELLRHRYDYTPY